MNDYNTIEYLAEYVDQKKKEERKKKAIKLMLGMALIPATVVAFFYLPSKIADTISYYQSKKYGEKKQEEDDLDGDE